MTFNEHFHLRDKHAILSASKYHWVNYSDEKMDQVFASSLAAQRGVELHAYAHNAIRLGIKQVNNNKSLNRYINDAIGFGMKSEQILYYSDNAFGCADSIAFKKKVLRIHDLKTGQERASETQLKIYAAFFILEYGLIFGITAFDIRMLLRIYQSDEVREFEADPDEIVHIMDRIITFDKRIDAQREGTL